MTKEKELPSMIKAIREARHELSMMEFYREDKEGKKIIDSLISVEGLLIAFRQLIQENKSKRRG